MLFAWINGQRRQPLSKGERARCGHCENELTAVLPLQNVAHWRHSSRDCDVWSEPEGAWHLKWKSYFRPEECEVSLIDKSSGERHRADILCSGHHYRTVVELQHSSIADEERAAREAFYGQEHRMFWLLDMADENSFREISLGMSLDFRSRPATVGNTQFYIMRWAGRSSQFIEKWKRSNEHVFLSYKDVVMYLATPKACSSIMSMLRKGEFALSLLSAAEFLEAVRG